MRVLKYVAATTSRAVWNQFPGVPRHRRDVVPVAPSARWRGDSTPSTRRCPRDRNLIHWLISTQDNRTALHLGAAEGHLAAVKYLVARGADVNAVDRWRGTPLRDAEAGEHTETVAFLKRVGAVNRRSASSLIDTPDSLSNNVSRSRSRSSLTASPSPSSSSIRRSLSFSTIRSPKVAPAPQTGGLVINPPARGSRDRDPMNVSMDRSNGSCAVS